MKILELPTYYYPEQISSSHLSSDLEEAYREAGYEVAIHAPTPCRGIDRETRKKYKERSYEERLNGAIKVSRFGMFAEPKKVLFRAIRYTLIQVKQYFRAICEKDIDVVYTASTPPTAGVIMSLVKKKLSKKYGHKVYFVYGLQDAFPDSLVFTGLTKKDSFFYKIGNHISEYTYKNADRIIAISNDLKAMLISKGVSEAKIVVIRNWIDTDIVKHVSKTENCLYDELDLPRDTFNVVYAGNLGKAQNVQIIISAAKILKQDESVAFLIFGSGVEEESLKQSIKQSNLTNVRMCPLQSVERVPEVYSTGDVAVITCKEGTGLRAFPSKTMSIFATGTPVIAAYDTESELSKLITDKQCGVVVSPDDVAALVGVIRTLNSNRSLLSEYGKNAREVATNEFDKKKCVREYISCFDCVNGK